MKSYSRIGTGSLSEAIKQATSGLTDPKIIFIFSADEDIKEACDMVMELYQGVDVIGIAGTTYNNGKVIDSSNFYKKENKRILQVMAFFDDAEITSGVMDKLDTTPLYKIKEFNDNLKKVNPNPDNTVCISFTTDYEENFISTTKTILEGRRISLVGGSVSGQFGKNVTSYLIYNGEKYEHAAVYMFIRNKVGKIKTYRNDTYIRQSDDAYQITKVGGGETQRNLIEVEGVKINKFFSEKYGFNIKELEKDPLKFTAETPLAIVIGDKTYVASIKNSNPDGSMDTFKKLYEGGSIAFMKMGDYAVMESDLLEKIKKDLNKISFIFSVDCLYRFFIYSGNGYMHTYLNGLNSLGEHVGYVGLGEQDQVQHFNQTMVCAVFE